MIKGVLVSLHIILCFVLIAVVIMQKGKGADIGAVFGGTSQTLFGSAGPGSFLQKLTVVIAAAFILTSLALSTFTGRPKRSIMENVKVPVTKAEQKSQTKGK